MIRSFGTLAVLVSLFLALPARAADDASKLKAAKALEAQMFTPAQWKKMTDKLDAQLAMQAKSEDLAPDALKVDSLVTYQEVADFQLGLLMKYYSEEELKALSAFYRTPTGKRSLEIMPELAQDLNGWMMARFSQRMPALLEKLRASHAASKAHAPSHR